MDTFMIINSRSIPVSISVDWDVYEMVPKSEINERIERGIRRIEKDLQSRLDHGRTNEKFFRITSLRAVVEIVDSEYKLVHMEYYPCGIYGNDNTEKYNGFGTFLIYDGRR